MDTIDLTPDFYRKYAMLDVDTLEKTLAKVSEILDKESKLVEISPSRVYFVGDTHGNFGVTSHAIQHLLPPKESIHTQFDKVVFLGDFIDRGQYAVYHINFLMSLKILFPDKIVLIRGNHETRDTNLRYGFYDDVISRYNIHIFEKYNRIFAKFPLAVITWNKIFAVHGGIPEGLEHLNEINGLDSEMDPEDKITFQILWNDPVEKKGWFFENFRGEYTKLFGKEAFEYFIKKNDIKLILRAHEDQKNGFKEYFNMRLISLDSSEKGWLKPEVKVFILEKDGNYNIASMEQYEPLNFERIFSNSNTPT